MIPLSSTVRGPDEGSSYRSAIFFSTPDQERIPKAYIAQLDRTHAFKLKIVTKVMPLQGFYRGEEYRQDYALHNPGNPYILTCDRPKIEALKREYPELFVDYKGQ